MFINTQYRSQLGRFGLKVLVAMGAAQSAGCTAGAEDVESIGTSEAALVCNGEQVPEFDACQRNLWPGGVIPYQFASAMSNGERLDVRAAMDGWQAVTGNRIQFVPSSSDSERVIITNGGSTDVGCTAGIPGKNVSPGTQTLWIEAGCPYAHELGHVIGLSHEHQRFDRDRSVHFGFAQTCATYFDNGLKCAYASSGSDFNPYHADSTMHYASNATFPILENGTNSPAPSSAQATFMDGSNARQMYAYEYGWAKYFPLGIDVGANEPLDNELAPGVGILGSPAVASQGQGFLDVYLRGSDQHIYHRFYANGWSGYVDLGDAFITDPGAASLGSGSALVAAGSSSGNTWLREFAGGAWQDWFSLGKPFGATTCSGPALTASGSTVRAFIRCDQTVYTRSRTSGTWGGWSSLGTPPSGVTFSGNPSAVALSSQITELFVTATNGHIYHKTRSSSGIWSSAWTDRACCSAAGSSPAVVGRGTRVDVLYQGSDGDLWWFNRVGGVWSGSATLGGWLASSPAAISSHSDHIDTLSILTDGGLWHRWYH